MKKTLFIGILLLLTSISAQEFRLLTFTDYYGQIELSTPYESLRQRTYIRPEFSIDLFNYFAYFTISGEYYYDVFNNDPMPEPLNILREAYISFYPDWGDIIIGQKLTNKGKVDVFSPLNQYNGVYRELLSLDEPYQSKRGDLQLELNYYINDENSLELIYIPFPRPDYQGKGELTVTADNKSYTLNKESEAYLFSSPHSLFLTYNRFDYNYDLQLAYNFYTEQNYNYSITENSIDKSFNRVHSIGAAISSSLFDTPIVQEIAFNITEDFYGLDPGIKNSDITLNTQVTKTLFGRTYAQVNMIYQHVFYYKAPESELSQAIYNIHQQPTDNILFFIFHLHDSFLREKLYLALNVGFFFSTNVYIAPRLNYKLSDNLTLETGIDLYTGEYKNNILEENLGGDNFFIRIKYEF